MNAPEFHAPGTLSDRKISGAALIIAAAATLMLVFQVVGQWTHDSPFAGVIFWAEVAAEITVVVTIAMAAPLALREMRGRRQLATTAIEARRQVEMLLKMSDMLQSAMCYADANAVLRATAGQLLPGFGGALYVFNNSGDRLDLSIAWDWPEDSQPADTVSPSHCWALKRGKPHVNQAGPGALRCEHHDQSVVVFEIPMMARAEIYGLFNVQASGPDAEARLSGVAPLAGAIADAMSLALSNIALREKLRTQALRDPLTGLYNRRYMEDVLERYANLAKRNDSPLTAIMIDLDHFKRLNDEHGHALGDSVLSGVAAAIVGAIRPCDIACRYGGEELVVLLPDCALIEGVAKAEMIRARIESLSENYGTRITASFGVATISETSAKAGDLLADADAALYRAKQEGRNRVGTAPPRSSGVVGLNLAAAAE